MKDLQKIYQSLPVGMLLCAVGGSLDADSFLLHGHVFAGLQTGNLVMLGAGYTQLSWMQITKYVVAFASFVIGLIITRAAQDHKRNYRRYCSWSTLAIWVEIILLLTVSIISGAVSNLIPVGIMSLVGAIQLQTFQRIEGNSFTPLMMMGHIKKTINFIDKGNRERVITNLASLGSFFMGAVITGLLIIWMNNWALGFAIVMLIMILIIAKLRR